MLPYREETSMNASVSTRPAAGSFATAVAWHGRIAYVTIDGALDTFSAREARALLLDLLEAQPSRLLVDVSAAFVDSSGIGVLVHVAQRTRQERRDFRLHCQENLAKILRMHELDKLLGVTAVPEARVTGSDRGRLAA
jgi:anti-anti-sigma factor